MDKAYRHINIDKEHNQLIMEIYIIRHGKTDWNNDRLLQGGTDIELNQDGIDLAMKTGEGLKNVDFDVVCSSPLKRAYKTAELIVGDRDIPIITDDRLREISFGSREGERSMAVKDDPNDPFYFFFHAPEKYDPLDGETFQSVMERTSSFLKEVVEPKENEYKRIMIVGHGAMNKGLQCHMLGHGVKDYWKGDLQHNCAFNIYELKDGKYTLLENNKTFFEK